MSRDRDTYTEETYDERRYDEYDDATAYGDEDVVEGSGWDVGLISLLIIVGAVLFFFPEPSTSMIGIMLMGLGAVAWLVDAFT